jgi:hypothetical protein
MNSHLFGAAIWGHFVALFQGGQGGKQELSAVYSHIVVCSLCCTCVVRVDFRILRKKYTPLSW